jgi:DNA adenine methylase
LYDSDDTFFYCDPPYAHGTRGDSKAYGYEMSDAQHIALAERLQKIKGRAAVSGYRGVLYDRLFKDWRRIDAAAKHCHSVKQERQECLWVNY